MCIRDSYRIIKRKTDAFEDIPAQDYYSIEEVFYDKDGNAEMHTSDIGVGAPTLEELKELVGRLNTAIENDVIVVGAAQNSNDNIKTGSAYIFVKETDIWEQKQKLIANDGSQDDYFGQSISIENDTILIGAPYADYESNSNSGSSYFYTLPQIDIIEEQVPAMGGIGFLALALSMLGLGAVRLRK